MMFYQIIECVQITLKCMPYRMNQTPAQINPKIQFEGIRGESLSTLKPSPDPKLKRILDEVGIKSFNIKMEFLIFHQ
ncbi:hypothetical protein AS588_16800 [Bacillus amyloliquefaciens]|nr:hypothetical protein AS588_16800 [Bacillus amyloliquefaciens]